MLYPLQGVVNLHGVSRLNMFSRNVVGSTGSRLDVSAPNWRQVYENRVTTASNGENGRNGIAGPTGE